MHDNSYALKSSPPALQCPAATKSPRRLKLQPYSTFQHRQSVRNRMMFGHKQGMHTIRMFGHCQTDAKLTSASTNGLPSFGLPKPDDAVLIPARQHGGIRRPADYLHPVLVALKHHKSVLP